MMKFVLLATAVTIAAPAVAQTPTGAPVQTPAQSVPSATGAQSTPAQTASSAPTTDPAQTAAQPTTQTTPASPQTTGTASASTTQQVSGSQVAQVVNTEFPTYDKDSNGALNATEFGSWMVALKTASDPSTKAESAATKSWIAGAFAQADKDKSKSVSKDELTGFLSQGQS